MEKKMTLSALKTPAFAAAPAQSPEKTALRAAITDPAHSPYEPLPQLFGRSPVQFALFGARGEDLGDGPFVFERADGLNDLAVLMPRLAEEPAAPEHRRERLAAQAFWSSVAQ
ncbi:hypothetical protein ACOI1H_13380 [Loktanella sp. DJP18]|uniref:hypothetical protein n=1 Tax=Loktanella sp. DJP18 TaxID=3409788 RepID=UPI003BB7ABEA